MEKDDFREAVSRAKELMTLDGMAMTMYEELDDAQVRDIIAGLYKYMRTDAEVV